MGRHLQVTVDVLPFFVKDQVSNSKPLIVKMKFLTLFIGVLFVSFHGQSLKGSSAQDFDSNAKQDNVLSSKELRAGWKLLFDGKSTAGWHNYLKDDVKGWQVKDGILFTEGKNGDLVTDQLYENFELTADWKIKEKGNSGIFYYVIEDKKYARIHMTGPEFQIIDDVNYPQQLQENQKTGSISDVKAQTILASNPVGEWNSTRIVVKNGQVTHYLNGKKVVESKINSPEWNDLVKASKFAVFDYAKVLKGSIGIQDHGGYVGYKNMKIRTL